MISTTKSDRALHISQCMRSVASRALEQQTTLPVEHVLGLALRVFLQETCNCRCLVAQVVSFAQQKTSFRQGVDDAQRTLTFQARGVERRSSVKAHVRFSNHALFTIDWASN
eukprot:TRINITY_DN10605_c0_g5_i1.p1 TRINITY_DN10605_c0_g5~~TRINITY_DN10605_c0_g5_i1.p1  ORF type:complete len:112 (-),score=4.83 TRINITY_DN10605_c0_g5_i1:2-337(-)